MSSDDQAGYPASRIGGVEGEGRGVGEQGPQGGSRLHPGQGRPDTEVRATTEGEMLPDSRAIEIQLVGSFEVGGVAIRRAPHEEEVRARRDLDTA